MLHHCCILSKEMITNIQQLNTSTDVNESYSCSDWNKWDAKFSALKKVCVLEHREDRLVKDDVSVCLLKENTGYASSILWCGLTGNSCVWCWWNQWWSHYCTHWPVKGLPAPPSACDCFLLHSCTHTGTCVYTTGRN